MAEPSALATLESASPAGGTSGALARQSGAGGAQESRACLLNSNSICSFPTFANRFELSASATYISGMLFERMRRRLAADTKFIEPCLPSPADKPPSGANWIHEIKHDGFRLMARRDPVGIRLITRRGNDWTQRYPLVVEAVNHLKVRSCLIDGEVVCCDERGWPPSSCSAIGGTSPRRSCTPSTCWS